jgi:hypothetical protein
MNTSNQVLAWCVGVLATGSILMWWSDTDLPFRLRKILRLPSWVGDHLQHPGYSGAGVSALVAIVVTIVSGGGPVFFLSCLLTWPVVANILLKESY